MMWGQIYLPLGDGGADGLDNAYNLVAGNHGKEGGGGPLSADLVEVTVALQKTRHEGA